MDEACTISSERYVLDSMFSLSPSSEAQSSELENGSALERFLIRYQYSPALNKNSTELSNTPRTFPLKPRNRRDFEIAIICALPTEIETVECLFDERWDAEGDLYGKALGDLNAYSTGVIGGHNVVLAHMPGIGKVSAASVAANCRVSFTEIKLALVVGICGGVPRGEDREDIHLGDVVISSGVIQSDFGKQYSDKFIMKDTLLDQLGRPNMEIRALLAKLSSRKSKKKLQKSMIKYLSSLNDELEGNVFYPGAAKDLAFESDYRHKHRDDSSCSTCAACNRKDDPVCEAATRLGCDQLGCNKALARRREENTNNSSADFHLNEHLPKVHFGLVASSDSVMKYGELREEIATKYNVIAFEMEGAGIWDNFPCLIIKGVCDYADSHKNKQWQGYAAATAASCAKAFLDHWVPRSRRTDNDLDTIGLISRDISPENDPNLLLRAVCNNFVERKSYISTLHQFFDELTESRKMFALWGLGGMGKTQLALSFAHDMKKRLSVYWLRADTFASFTEDYVQIASPNKRQNTASPLNLEDQLASVKQTLEQQCDRWLLILDNADDISQFLVDQHQPTADKILNYVPKKGRILITSRDRRFQGMVAGAKNGIQVLEMTDDEATALLLGSLTESLPLTENDSSSASLVNELGNLPLAIAQAAANIAELQISVKQYMEYYRKKANRIKLMEQPVNDLEGLKSFSVLVTFEVSLDTIQERSPLTIKFLHYLGFFYPKRISDVFLRSLPEFEPLDELGFRNVTKHGVHLSLIESRVFDDGHTEFSVHPVVHDWILYRLSSDETKVYLEPVIKIMCIFIESVHEKILTIPKFPKPGFESADIERKTLAFLISHALHQIGIASDSDYCSEYYLGFLYITAKAMSIIGHVSLAVEAASHAYNTAKILFHESEAIIAESHEFMALRNLLAYLLQNDQYQEADQIAEKALFELGKQEISASVTKSAQMGLEYEMFLLSVRFKSASYIYMHKEAEGFVRRQLEIAEALDSMELPTFKHNLANCLQHQARLDDAKLINNQLIQFAETEDGKKIINLDLYLKFLNLKGHILLRCERDITEITEGTQEALRIYRSVYEQSKEALGISHKDTIIAANNVLRNLMQQGNHAEAYTLIIEVMEGLVSDGFYFEGEIARTVSYTLSLGWILLEIEGFMADKNMERSSFSGKRTIDANTAARLSELRSELAKNTCWAEHDNLAELDVWNNLGVIHQRKGNFLEAERMARVCTARPESRHTKNSVYWYNLMLAIARQGRLEEAIEYRDSELEMILPSEAIYGTLFERMERDKEDLSVYKLAQALISKGELEIDGIWWQEHKAVLERTQLRYGTVVLPLSCTPEAQEVGSSNQMDFNENVSPVHAQSLKKKSRFRKMFRSWMS